MDEKEEFTGNAMDGESGWLLGTSRRHSQDRIYYVFKNIFLTPYVKLSGVGKGVKKDKQNSSELTFIFSTYFRRLLFIYF